MYMYVCLCERACPAGPVYIVLCACLQPADTIVRSDGAKQTASATLILRPRKFAHGLKTYHTNSKLLGASRSILIALAAWMLAQAYGAIASS